MVSEQGGTLPGFQAPIPTLRRAQGSSWAGEAQQEVYDTVRTSAVDMVFPEKGGTVLQPANHVCQIDVAFLSSFISFPVLYLFIFHVFEWNPLQYNGVVRIYEHVCKLPLGGFYFILQPAGSDASDWPRGCGASFRSLHTPLCWTSLEPLCAILTAKHVEFALFLTSCCFI